MHWPQRGNRALPSARRTCLSGEVLCLGLPCSLLCCCPEALNSAVGVPLGQVQGAGKESSGEWPWPELFRSSPSRNNLSMAEVTLWRGTGWETWGWISQFLGLWWLGALWSGGAGSASLPAAAECEAAFRLQPFWQQYCAVRGIGKAECSCEAVQGWSSGKRHGKRAHLDSLILWIPVF